MPLHVSSTCAHHQVKIALHSLWYHHTCRWPSGAQVEREDSQSSLSTCAPDGHLQVWWYQRLCNAIWPPGDGHMCSKHVEAWNKLIVKQKRLCIKLVNYWDNYKPVFFKLLSSGSWGSAKCWWKIGKFVCRRKYVSQIQAIRTFNCGNI